MKRNFHARTVFKMALSFVLVCLMITALCACKNNGDQVASQDTASDSVADTSALTDNGGKDEGSSDKGDAAADNADPEQEIPEAEVFFLNSPATKVRFFGEREYKDGIFVSCNYPGSGFEGRIKSNGGDVSVKLDADKKCSFLVYVDGKPLLNADGTAIYTSADGMISIGGIAEGEHTLRVIRASGYGVNVRLYALSFSGKMLENSAADEYRGFIEFIGDGINNTLGNTSFSENVAVTYPYLVAQQLNVDYSITTYNDNGLVSTRVPITELYGSEESGDYSRRASIAVINVGEKDVIAAESGTIDMSDFMSKYASLAQKVKEINGSDCRVLMICTGGGDAFKDAVSAACDSLGGANSGYFFKMLSASPGVLHTETEHAAYASEIISAIEEVKNFTIQALNHGSSGMGNTISYDSAKWGTL